MIILVIKYLIIYAVSAVVMSAGFYVFSAHISDIRALQAGEMCIIYPQLADTIEENFGYYKSAADKTVLWLWAFCMSILAIVCIFLCVCELYNDNVKNKTLLKEIDSICTQLKGFRAGDFDRTFTAEFDDFKALEEDLHETGVYFADLKERLSEEEESTKRLITDISHQLKTPLSSLKMSYELAVGENLSESERKEFILQEKRELDKLETLVGELVRLSRLESHMIQLDVRENDMAEVIADAVSEIFMKAHAKNITIDAELERDCRVLCDKRWTTEAISNVIDNAVKYSAEGTRILVSAKRLPTLVVTDISDSGIGIPRDELNNIFKRFYRGKGASDYAKEGAGVGLYIARRILEDEKGTIMAMQNPCGGTIFRITLPVQSR